MTFRHTYDTNLIYIYIHIYIYREREREEMLDVLRQLAVQIPQTQLGLQNQGREALSEETNSL